MDSYWVYILQVSNGNYYTGCTTDIRRRYREHVDGSGGCRYTRSFPPEKLVQCWRIFDSKGTALRIEHYVKKKPRATKDQVIRDPEMLIRMLDQSSITCEGVEACSAGMINDINTYSKGKPPGKGGKKPGGHR